MTVAEHQLRAIAAAGQVAPGSLSSLRVVTGHGAHAIDDFLAENREHNVLPIHNPEYKALNNWYSLLLALRSVPVTDDTTVIVFNGDLLASEAWMTQFIVDSYQSASDALIAVDIQRELTDESMKVSAKPTGATTGLFLGEIGKVGVNEPVGEYVGMLMARGACLRMLISSLESFGGSEKHANEWYERAVGLTAADGALWSIWPTPNSQWVEIDDDSDYATATLIVE